MHVSESTKHEPELAVRLNGYLLRSDLLFETASAYVASHPQRALQLVRWARSGRAELKRGLANATSVDVTTLPYDERVIAEVRRARADGRRVVLQTASDPLLAERISAYLGLFDEVVTFDSASEHRTRAIDDGRAVYISRPERTRDLRTRAITLGRALRIHQWVKNLLIFVPFALSFTWQSLPSGLSAVLAFIVFGLVASSVYLLNDLVDVGDDRHHHRKRTRPFASGELDLRTGWLLWPALLVVAFTTAALLLPPLFTLCLAGYFVTTVSYSFFLKRRAIFDVVTLAVLYTARVVAGAAAVSVAPSFWLLAFSLFIFLSLAFIKRFSELRLAGQTQPRNETLRGRSYVPGDAELVSSLGVSAGYGAVVVFALYINDAHTAHLYSTPQFLWLAGPLLLFWISRAWMITHRGDMHDDPVVFAIKDRVSWIVVALCAVVFALGKLVG